MKFLDFSPNTQAVTIASRHFKTKLSFIGKNESESKLNGNEIKNLNKSDISGGCVSNSLDITQTNISSNICNRGIIGGGNAVYFDSGNYFEIVFLKTFEMYVCSFNLSNSNHSYIPFFHFYFIFLLFFYFFTILLLSQILFKKSGPKQAAVSEQDIADDYYIIRSDDAYI